MSSWMDSTNPYDPPEVELHPPEEVRRNPQRAATAIRLRHLDDEALVRSVALLFRILTALLPLAGFAVGLRIGRAGGWTATGLGLIIVAILAPVASGLISHGLIRLRPWASVGAMGLALAGCSITAAGAIASLKSPEPLLLSSFILLMVPQALVVFLLASRDGRFLFSGRYRQAVAATPHLNPKTSVLVPLAFGVVGAWTAFAWLWRATGG